MKIKNYFLLFVFLFLFLSGCSNSNSTNVNVSQLEDKVDILVEKNSKLTTKIEEQQSIINDIKEDLKSQNNVSSAINDEIDIITTMLKNTGDVFITESEEMEIANKLNGNTKVKKWETTFNEKYSPKLLNEEDKKPRAVWKIEATHPFGNRTIFYLDAVSGKVVNLRELEPPKSGAASRSNGCI